MATFVHSFASRHVLCIDHEKFSSIGKLKQHLISDKVIEPKSCFLICNGTIVEDSDPVKKDVTYHTYLRLPGGKGGFGSMLRAIGAQIEKTTNHEACRDLSGRRMRDINNEKELKDWLGKQAEREREREQKRQERIARRRAMPNHKFSDPLYDEQKALLAEMQEDALQTGLKKAFASSTVTSEEPGSSKRKADSEGPSCSGVNKSKKKKATEWLGMDIDNISDLDSSEDDDTSDNKQSNSEYTSSHSEEGNSRQSEDCVAAQDNSTVNVTENSDKTVNNSGTGDNVSESGINKSEIFEGKEINDGSAVAAEQNKEDDSMQETKPFVLDEVTCVGDVEKLGLDRLKQELLDRGLKCGGTLEQRAERLYSVKGLNKDQIDPSLFAKSSNGKKVKNRK